MLSKKGVLTLNHSNMISHAYFFCRIYKSICNTKIRHCWIFNRCEFPACSFHSNCACGNNHVSAQDILLHTTTGSNSDKSVGSTFSQLIYCNGSRRTANSSRGHADLHPINCSCIGYKFSAVCN